MKTILPVFFYVCENWSLTVRNDHRHRVFENKVLERMIWPKRNEVTGEWRKLYNEELNDLHSHTIVQVIKSRRIRWAGHVAPMRLGRIVYRILVGKPEPKRPLGKTQAFMGV
jgi:hypothetical protein